MEAHLEGVSPKPLMVGRVAPRTRRLAKAPFYSNRRAARLTLSPVGMPSCLAKKTADIAVRRF